MPIENLEPSKPNNESLPSSLMVPFQTVFQSNNMVVAGALKVRHSFMEEPCLLYGFIGEAGGMNFDDFEVQGMTIVYNKKIDNSRHSTTIFPKIIVDLKKTLVFELFPELNAIRDTNGRDRVDRKWGSYTKKNYYFFKNLNDSLPDAVSDEIYLVCKYKEDGKFKYQLFAPHEVTISKP